MHGLNNRSQFAILLKYVNANGAGQITCAVPVNLGDQLINRDTAVGGKSLEVGPKGIFQRHAGAMPVQNDRVLLDFAGVSLIRHFIRNDGYEILGGSTVCQ